MNEREVANTEPIWCLVANVLEARLCGPGGMEARRGTKHFASGAKLYCFPPLWGDGCEKVKVVGRHRGSHRYVTMVVRSKWLTNWRAELVYSPHVIRELSGHWDGAEASRCRAEGLAAWLRGEAPPPRDGWLPSLWRRLLAMLKRH